MIISPKILQKFQKHWKNIVKIIEPFKTNNFNMLYIHLHVPYLFSDIKQSFTNKN